MEIPDGLGVAVEPAVAENDADCVGAALELVGDVVGDVERATVVAGVAGVKDVVADFPAVEVKLVVTKPADLGAGLLDIAVELEGTA